MPADRSSSGRPPPIGLMVAGSEMASFTIIGLILDFAFDTIPWLTIVLTLLGLALGFFHLVKMSQAMAAKKSDTGEPRDPGQAGSPPSGDVS